jgi:proteasome accessory factor B
MPPIRKEERILNLLSALLAARAPLPFSGIRGKVVGYDDDASREALEKRFDRDKATLRKLGVPVEYVLEDEFGQTGYRVARERFFLDEIHFTVEEGIVLAALQRALSGKNALRDGLHSALLKLGVDSPLPQALRESVGEQQVLDPRLSTGRRDEAERLGAISEALLALRPVAFSYYSLGRGEVSDRTVEPYGVGYARGHWYLVGRDTAKGELRVFRTDRIRSQVRLLPPGGYEIPGGFSLGDHLDFRPWDLGGGRSVEVRIRFTPDVAWMIGENLRTGQEFSSAPDGSGVLTLRARAPRKLVPWVARHGTAAEILDPPWLREEMRAHLTAILGRYRS